MKDQVLSIEQMRELIDLGIDTSKASIFWHHNVKDGKGNDISKNTTPYLSFNSFPRDIFQELGVTVNIIPTFTLQDILTLLEPYHRLMVVRHEPNEWIDSAFELLKFQYRNRNS